MKLRAAIPFSELVTVSGQPARTLRRRLAQRGVSCDGHYVMLADLKEAWPSMFNSLLILAEDPTPACPACGSPTHRACTACEFVAA